MRPNNILASHNIIHSTQGNPQKLIMFGENVKSQGCQLKGVK